MEEANTNALAWSPSHIDDIFVKKFLELAEREARYKELISWTGKNDDNRNFDDNELLKIVMENWVEGIIFKKDGRRHIIGKGEFANCLLGFTNNLQMSIYALAKVAALQNRFYSIRILIIVIFI